MGLNDEYEVTIGFQRHYISSLFNSLQLLHKQNSSEFGVAMEILMSLYAEAIGKYVIIKQCNANGEGISECRVAVTKLGHDLYKIYSSKLGVGSDFLRKAGIKEVKWLKTKYGHYYLFETQKVPTGIAIYDIESIRYFTLARGEKAISGVVSEQRDSIVEFCQDLRNALDD